jgi:hypothetical protein
VAQISLPETAVASRSGAFTTSLTTTSIDPSQKLVGFQGDFTFDSRVITFEEEPVQAAGLTSSNWNVSGSVLPGNGPIRTLRVSAYSTDFQPLSGSGVLFELKMKPTGDASQKTTLAWAQAPNLFIFIDADLNVQKPGHVAPGQVTLKR